MQPRGVLLSCVLNTGELYKASMDRAPSVCENANLKVIQKYFLLL